MPEGTYDAVAGLARAARFIFKDRSGRPVFFALTDPDRTPDPVQLSRALPSGSGLILRHFGQTHLKALARPLARLCARRGQTFLIAADPHLAHRVGADGVHWPERARQNHRSWQRRHPEWIMTTSAHGQAGLTSAHGFDAVFLSPVFASASPSAHQPLNHDDIRRWTLKARVPVYGLGGITQDRLQTVHALGLSGCGAVSARSRDAD